MLGVCGEQAVREQLGESEAGIFRSVLHVVSHCGLELLHELGWGRAELLNHFIPLIDVWAGAQLGKRGKQTSRTNHLNAQPSGMWLYSFQYFILDNDLKHLGGTVLHKSGSFQWVNYFPSLVAVPKHHHRLLYPHPQIPGSHFDDNVIYHLSNGSWAFPGVSIQWDLYDTRCPGGSIQLNRYDSRCMPKRHLNWFSEFREATALFQGSFRSFWSLNTLSQPSRET